MLFMNLLGAASYPGQVLYLYVRSDAGIAFLLAILHIPQVENASDYVQQLLCREDTERGKTRTRKMVSGTETMKDELIQRGGD